MKIFDITNPRHQEILAEEIQRAKQILLREYNEDAIWASMSDDERWDTIASVRDDEGPDDADRYASEKWDDIPDSLTDRMDLSVFQKASMDQGGRTNIRAINNYIKKNPEIQKLVDAFLKKVKRNTLDDITTTQSYKLLRAVHKFNPSEGWNMRVGTNYNPYEAPGGEPSRGPMGGSWTGD